MNVKFKFVIGAIDEAEVKFLEDGCTIISKMILTPDDFRIFQYKAGDNIQVETNQGYRLWCYIMNLEIIQNNERAIIIFTLAKK